MTPFWWETPCDHRNLVHCSIRPPFLIFSNKFLVRFPQKERDHAFLPTSHDRWQHSDLRCFQHMGVTAMGTWISHRCFSSRPAGTDALISRGDKQGYLCWRHSTKHRLPSCFSCQLKKERGIQKKQHWRMPVETGRGKSPTRTVRFHSLLAAP